MAAAPSGAAGPPVASVSSPPAPVRTTAATAGDAAAIDACRQVTGAESDNFTVMMTIGARAAQSSIMDIRIDGNLLHDFAELASKGPTSERDPMGYLKNWTEVTGAQADLLEACNRNRIAK